MNGEKINEIMFRGIIGTEIVFGAFFFLVGGVLHMKIIGYVVLIAVCFCILYMMYGARMI